MQGKGVFSRRVLGEEGVWEEGIQGRECRGECRGRCTGHPQALPTLGLLPLRLRNCLQRGIPRGPPFLQKPHPSLNLRLGPGKYCE